MIQIERFVAGLYAVNCFIIYDDESKDAFIIDPSGAVEKIAHFIGKENLNLKGILLTHAHGDHHLGLAHLKELYNAPVYLHASDVYMAKDANINLSVEMGKISEFTPDIQLQDGMKIQIGESVIKVLHTPGHTKGGVCYYLAPYLFAGDTLFAGSVGRTDLDGGNMEQLIRAIKNQLLKLPEDTIVFAGHGEASTIGREKARNPYLVR